MDYLRSIDSTLLKKPAVRRLTSIRKAVRVLATQQGYDLEDLAACADRFSDDEIAKTAAGFDKGIVAATVNSLRAFIGTMMAFDRNHGTDGDSEGNTLMDRACTETPTAAQIFEQKDEIDAKAQSLTAALEKLTANQAKTVRMLYGFGYDREFTRAEIAKHFGVSEQCTNLRIQTALSRLRQIMSETETSLQTV